jgi:HK97 family phage major capsid protein
MRGIDQHLLVYGDPAYADAFTKVVTGRESLLSAEERAALARADEFERAASIGTTTAGGFMIPTILDPSVILAVDGSSNPFRQISTVKSIMTNTWTGVSSAGISMSWDTEGSEVSDDTFTLSQPTITAYKLAGFVPFSIEAEDDISGLNTEIAREFAQAKDDAEEAVFAVGTGSNQPIGIVTALVGSSWTNFATNNALTVADLEKVRRHTGPRYRGAKASWVMNMAWNDAIRNLGTSGSLYSETVDLPELAVSKVLGSTVYESSSMTDAVNTTTTNNAVVYGDFSHYYIVDRIGTRLEYIPHLFATGNNRPSGQRGWYTYHRVGADSVNDQAFTLGVSPNTAFT